MATPWLFIGPKAQQRLSVPFRLPNTSLACSVPNPVSDWKAMNLLLMHATPSCSIPHHLSHFKSKASPISATAIPPRDRVVDFGKHRGKMLGSLPSTYLKWVSSNLRARDFQEWATLADQVLQDPVYQDRIEWEFAQRLLNGDGASSSPGSDTVSELLQISRRFGWDNDDKVGWSKVDFALLGTSKGGRIPRISSNGGAKTELRLNREKDGVRGGGGGEVRGGERRRDRRDRLRLKRTGGSQVEATEIQGKHGGASLEGGKKMDRDRTVQNRSPFPGRDALLRKVLNRRSL